MDEELFSEVRHDIVSPLAGIKALVGLTDRSLDRQDVASARQTIKKLNSRIDELVKIIDTTLEQLR